MFLLINAGRLQTMTIDHDGCVSWQEGPRWIDPAWSLTFSACYYQGQVVLVADSRTLLYDVLGQTVIELADKLPLPGLHGVTMAEVNGQILACGGLYTHAPATLMPSNRVFALVRSGIKPDSWVEQEARLLNPRSHTPTIAATYQNKLWLASGYVRSNLSSTIEVFDPLVGSWQPAGNLTRDTSDTALIAINDELFAATSTVFGLRIEKRNQETGAWELVSDILDGNRLFCAWASCGSTIYVFGGAKTSWNSFDTGTNTWASQQEQYQDEATRQIPNGFRYGQSVCITPSDQIKGVTTWRFGGAGGGGAGGSFGGGSFGGAGAGGSFGGGGAGEWW